MFTINTSALRDLMYQTLYGVKSVHVFEYLTSMKSGNICHLTCAQITTELLLNFKKIFFFIFQTKLQQKTRASLYTGLLQQTQKKHVKNRNTKATIKQTKIT